MTRVVIRKRPRDIKALSAEDIEQYLNGEGMGFALSAELNAYLGPRHVLDLADSLKLDDDRRHTIGTIFDRMHAEAVRLGTDIVRLEAELDSAFAQGAITALLSEHEIHEYQRMRGYVHSQHMHGN